MRTRINLMNGKGDECVLEFDPAVEGEVQVAADKLDAFWQKCIADNYGYEPAVFGRNPKTQEFDYFKVGKSDLTKVDDLVMHMPLVGG